MNRHIFIGWILVFACYVGAVHGQLLSEADIQKRRLELVRNAFSETMPLYDLLKNGRQYLHYYPSINGNQYFGDQFLHHGKLHYGTLAYDSINIGYDLYNDMVFVSVYHDLKQEQLILDKEKIEDFQMGDAHFRYVTDSTIQGLETGVYQLAFDGIRNQLFVKYTKTKERNSLQFRGQKLHKFVEGQEYYLVRDGRAILLRSKKQVLKLLEDDGTLRNYIRRNQLFLRLRKSGYVQPLVRILEAAES